MCNPERQGEGKAADSLQRLYANVIVAGGGSEIKVRLGRNQTSLQGRNPTQQACLTETRQACKGFCQEVSACWQKPDTGVRRCRPRSAGAGPGLQAPCRLLQTYVGRPQTAAADTPDRLQALADPVRRLKSVMMTVRTTFVVV